MEEINICVENCSEQAPLGGADSSGRSPGQDLPAALGHRICHQHSGTSDGSSVCTAPADIHAGARPGRMCPQVMAILWPFAGGRTVPSSLPGREAISEWPVPSEVPDVGIHTGPA